MANTDSSVGSESSTDLDPAADSTPKQVRSLARQLTRGSAKQVDDGAENSAIMPIQASSLDPYSENFNSVSWFRAFVRLFESDPHSAPPRMTGVAYRNLGVYGHSTGTQYQESTGNIFFSMFSYAFARATGRASRRIDILQDFEGVLDPGEMLLVLGPPGSGCSTLLKTLSGRTEGLQVTDASYINFRGELLSLPHVVQAPR